MCKQRGVAGITEKGIWKTWIKAKSRSYNLIASVFCLGSDAQATSAPGFCLGITHTYIQHWNIPLKIWSSDWLWQQSWWNRFFPSSVRPSVHPVRLSSVRALSVRVANISEPNTRISLTFWLSLPLGHGRFFFFFILFFFIFTNISRFVFYGTPWERKFQKATPPRNRSRKFF